MRSLLVTLGALAVMGAAVAQSPPRDASKLIERLAVVLDLEDYQKTQVKEVFDAQREKLDAQRAQLDASGKRPSFEEMRTQHEALKKELRESLSAILTPEQLKKFDAFMPERGPGPMGPPAEQPPGE